MNDIAATLRDLLRDYPELELAMLFGSHAADRVGADSDIDIGVLAAAPLGAHRKHEMISAIALAFGRPVDLIDLHGYPEPVTGEALRGLRLLGSDDRFAEALDRHLWNLEDFVPLQMRMLDERRARWLR